MQTKHYLSLRYIIIAYLKFVVSHEYELKKLFHYSY